MSPQDVLAVHKHLPTDPERLKKYATIASVCVAITLIFAKLAAWLATGSVALLTSLVDSTIDLLASVVTMLGVTKALRPPDHDHRFGHGKAEPLAALAQAAFIIGSSVLLGYEALGRFFHQTLVENISIGYVVMIFAIILTLVLVQFQTYVTKRTNSIAIAADRMHYYGDAAINIAVIAAFILQELTGLYWVDPAFALGIAFAMIYSASRVGREALNILMDKELPLSDREKITAAALSCEGVLGLHDLRTRTDSGRAFIEFHLELPQNMTLLHAHAVTECVISRLKTDYADASITIRQDPVGIKEARLDEQIVQNEVKSAQEN